MMKRGPTYFEMFADGFDVTSPLQFTPDTPALVRLSLIIHFSLCFAHSRIRWNQYLTSGDLHM